MERLEIPMETAVKERKPKSDGKRRGATAEEMSAKHLMQHPITQR